MRKNFILFVLVPLILLGLVVYVFIDGWIEHGLEYAAERIVGARVEIDDLRLTVSPLALEFRRMQVASPRDTWTNLFETGRVRFSADAGQLLRAKVIIDTIEVHNVILGTRRTTDGALPEHRRDAALERNRSAGFTAMAEQLLDKSVERTPLFDIALLRKGLNLDSLVRAFDFVTIRHIDTLKQRAGAAVTQWEAVRQDFSAASRRLGQVETELKSINPSELKTAESILSAIQKADNSLKTINEVRQGVSSRRDAVAAELQAISDAVGAIEDRALADLRTIQSLARLPQLKTGGIAEALLGPAILDDVARAMYWIDFARTNVKRYTPAPEIEKPPRLEGQNIHFPVARSYPKFWIQHVRISGGTDSTRSTDHFHVSGRIRHVSSDQRVTGEPLMIDILGRRGRKEQLTFSAMMDRRKEEPFDSYDAEIRGIRLADMAIGSPTFLPAVITGAGLTTSFKVRVPAKRFDGTLGLQFRSMQLRYAADPRNTVERLTREVLGGINGFDASLRVWNTAGGLSMALQTDLDDQFFARVKSVIGAEVARLQAELKAKVDAKIAEKRREFEALYAEKRRQIEKQLAEYQVLVDSNLALVESRKKELNDRLDQVKKGAVDDAMKRLLRK